jgi:hypothetical protein
MEVPVKIVFGLLETGNFFFLDFGMLGCLTGDIFAFPPFRMNAIQAMHIFKIGAGHRLSTLFKAIIVEM